MNMDITKFSQKYRVDFLEPDDVELIYNLCIKNPMYYKFCPPMVTFESIRNDMEALPPNKTMDDKYYVGYFDESSNLVTVMDLIAKYPDEQTAFIGFFMVNKECQGKGVGSSIVSELVYHLQILGFQKIRLGYVEGNCQSEKFWEKNGFVDTGVRSRNDDYMVVVMERSII